MYTLHPFTPTALLSFFFSHLSAKTRLRNEKSTVAPVALTINGLEFHSCRAALHMNVHVDILEYN